MSESYHIDLLHAMITKLTHSTILVLDLDRAYDFYVNKLGFAVRTDVTVDGQRWLTVGPEDQPELEIVLTQVAPGYRFSDDQVEVLSELVRAGVFGASVFGCDDLEATYEALQKRGVEFSKPPTREQYGYEAIFKDDSGNWFSLVENA